MYNTKGMYQDFLIDQGGKFAIAPLITILYYPSISAVKVTPSTIITLILKKITNKSEPQSIV
jgi:hypothetical protein